MKSVFMERNIGSERFALKAVVPDSMAAVAELKCGAVASYHLSNCACSAPGHSIEVYGTRGSLVYRFFAEEIFGAREGQALSPIPIPDEEERKQTTDAEFIEAIRGGGRVEPDFQEGLLYMRFCEAVALSSYTGRIVSIDDLTSSMLAWGQPL